jgi:peroxiredoxin
MVPSVKQNFLIAIVAVAIAFVIFLLGHPSRSADQHSNLTVNMVAPDFSMPELRGGQFQLSAYRGKIVLLDFWATWCDPCREEIPHLVELQSKYRDRGLEIVGVSMDDGPEPVRDYYQRFKMNYPVVMGNAKIGELYGGVLGLPIAFVIGRDGRIQSKHIGATDISIFENEIANLLQN